MRIDNKRKVAIFDIDGTVFRSSLLIELVDALIAKEYFPKSAVAEYEKLKVKWLDRRGDYESYIEAVVGVFMGHIKGIHYKDFADVAKEVVLFNQNRTYVYARGLIKDLKKKGYFVLAISQSPKTILETFCKNMGFDKVYGRIFELGPSNKFTGKIIDLHIIANKANIVRRAVEKENLTLKGSYGVGDTEGDIPMLELVDNPICFNPNLKLRKHARRMGWPVVVERKDVIYSL